jgi:hypothetical protein
VAAKKTIKASGSAKATIDHDEIREWVESHGGHPAMVKSTARNGQGGILRIDFPGFSGERSLKEVSWDEFFEKFEQSELAFLYQDQTASARPSRFNKLVSRASIAESAENDGGRAQPRAAQPRKKAVKKSARRTSAGGSAATKKRPAKRAEGAQARRAAPKSARGASARGASARGASARGASARGTRQGTGSSPKKKTSGQTKKRASA